MITVTKAEIPKIEKYQHYLEIIWRNRWLTNNGELVQQFEKKLETFLSITNPVLVANGTLALELGIQALNLTGEIITTPFTFVATINSIIRSNLIPIFADIDINTFNLNPNCIEEKITENTQAILAVHVYGNPCDMEKIQKIADRHNLKIICDAAHAFGVSYKNKSILDYGDISTLSFHATKVFNTIEGGAIICRNTDIIKKLKLLRNHGIMSEDEIRFPGTNAKMNEFQAAMGLCNLERVKEIIQKRMNIYFYYKNNLGNSQVKFQELNASHYNYGYMPVCFENKRIRDAIYNELMKNNIFSRKYFYPLAFRYSDFNKLKIEPDEFSIINAINISNQILCLPLYSDLDLNDVDRIIRIINELL